MKKIGMILLVIWPCTSVQCTIAVFFVCFFLFCVLHRFKTTVQMFAQRLQQQNGYIQLIILKSHHPLIHLQVIAAQHLLSHRFRLQEALHLVLPGKILTPYQSHHLSLSQPPNHNWKGLRFLKCGAHQSWQQLMPPQLRTKEKTSHQVFETKLSVTLSPKCTLTCQSQLRHSSQK